jgi:hypothetical protein
MKKRLVMLVAVVAVIAIALPALALEFKYGGMYRLRWQSNDNVTDGASAFDDNQNYMDQRLRMYFDFVASENLRVVTKWEVDTMWGNGFDKFSTGGGVGADSINLEMKNAYVDFNIPYTPVRATLGVQGVSFLTGWIVDDDFSSAKFTARFDPVRVTMGYIAGQNNDVTTSTDNIDDWYLSVDYAGGPFKASLVGFFQDGHNTDVSTFFNPRMSSGSIGEGSNVGFYSVGGANVPTNSIVNSVTSSTIPPVTTDLVNNNYLFDVGLSLAYKIDWVNAYLNFVKNFGSFDLLPNSADRSVDYTGYMIDGGANFYYGPLTFNLGGFLASGDDFSPNQDDSDGNFRYPRGASHYWSEILGLGTLDQAVGGSYLNPVRAVPRSTRTGDQLVDAVKLPPGRVPGTQNTYPRGNGYMAADVPSNLWMVNAGIAYQALERTKLTLNYYYIGVQEDVTSGFHFNNAGNLILEKDSSIGNELDLYIDQGIVDGLDLRIVGAYLFASDGYTVLPSDDEDDAWEAGFRLQWNF